MSLLESRGERTGIEGAAQREDDSDVRVRGFAQVPYPELLGWWRRVAGAALAEEGNQVTPRPYALAVAAPHQEGATLAIARAAARRGVLDRLFLSMKPAGFRPPMLRRLKAMQPPSGIPPDAISGLVPFHEVLRAAASHSPHPEWGGRVMYREMARFDAALARRVHADVVVGMFGSSSEAFEAVKRKGGIAVLNFVNSHPIHHNRFLVDVAQVTDRERIPSDVAQRVDRELDQADMVLVPSRFVAGQLAQGGWSSKVVVEPYGVNISAFFPDDKRVGRQAPMRCLFVGQISHRKGVRFLVEAARLLRGEPIEIKLVGPLVSPEVLSGIESVPGIAYEGSVPHAEVAKLMRSADVFVLPSVEDAYALVVLEAMASGLPVVVTSNNGAAEVVSDGEEGFVVPAGDPEALAERLRLLAREPDRRRSMGAAARRSVEGAHTWESYGDRVLTRIENVLETTR